MDEKIKIVCVEDEPDVIELIRIILRDPKYDFTGALGGQQGIDTIRELKPDLVFLDLMMPDVDGWAVYRQMKADPELQHIPVILVTAKADNIDKVLAVHIAKVDDYITKPFGPKELIASVRRVLGIK